jgi:hypothetical protein
MHSQVDIEKTPGLTSAAERARNPLCEFGALRRKWVPLVPFIKTGG